MEVLILYRVVMWMLNRAFGTQQPILGLRGLFMDGRLCARPRWLRERIRYGRYHHWCWAVFWD